MADRRLTPERAWWQAYLRGSETSIVDAPARKLRAVDLFCGSGGLSLGLREAGRALGFDVEMVAAVDLDADALDVYAYNLRPKWTINQDVSALVDYMAMGDREGSSFAYPPEIVDERILPEVGSVDVLIAGPPCQGHSNLNNKTRRDDPRNILYVTTVAIAVALKARMVLIENVPEVVRDKNSVVVTAIALLKSAGYRFVEGTVLRADHLGGAQTRKRYFLSAVREDVPGPEISLLSVPTVFSRKPSSVSWAIGDLEKAKPVGVMSSVPALSAENRERIDYLFDNDVDDLPNHIRPDCHKEGTTYKAVYGRMYWDKPAPTLTTGFMSPGRGRFVHPRQRRVLTPHEAARIQSFPDWYSFTPNEQEPSRVLLGKWIGDAVPAILGYFAALPGLSGLLKD